MSIDYITTMSTCDSIEAPSILGFSPNFIHPHKKYYLPVSSYPDNYQIIPSDADTWNTLTVWNVPDDDYSIQALYRAFSFIGQVIHIKRLHTHIDVHDENPLTVIFATWNVNYVTSILADELTMCNLYNQHVALSDKYYITMFYDLDDGMGHQELYVEIQ